MEVSPNIVKNNFARKRQRQPEKWKQNIAKKLRYSAKSLPERVCNHNSHALQCATLSMENLMILHKKFYEHDNKKDQDAMILKFCSIEPVKRDDMYKGKKQTTIKYSVYINKKKVPICKNFFIKIFGVTKHRIAYVMNRFYYNGDVSITEKRGGNHKEKKYSAQKQAVHSFIQKLKCIESHYCRKTKIAERKYMPSELNIKKLYKMFMESGDAHPNVKASYFRRIFNTNYNLGFGTPKTDVCSKCLELTEKIKIETDPDKKNKLIIEKRVHSLRAKAFFEKLKEVEDGLKIISFDCQKNLPLPKVPDQICYYSRQIYFYNLTMVEGSSTQPLTKERVFSYYCTENEFNKDSNLVASAVYHRLTETDKTNITRIRLVADGCGGQNKNCILIGACSKWLLENEDIKSIELVFPVTGHSFMPADRQFGIVERKLRKLEVILHPNEITDVLAETSTLIKLGRDCPVVNWRESVKKIVKQTTSWPMKLKECKRFILKRSKRVGNVLVRGETFYKSDLATPANVCQRQKVMQMINPEPLPTSISVNKRKIEDVDNLLRKHFGSEWREIPALNFYKELIISQRELPDSNSAETDLYCQEPLEDDITLRV